MALDVEKLLASEVKRVKALLATEDFRLVHQTPILQKLTPEELVKRCYAVHEELVQRWGGWAFHGEIGEVEESADQKHVRVVNIYDTWRTTVRAARIAQVDGLHPQDETHLNLSIPGWGGLQSWEQLLSRKNIEIGEAVRDRRNMKLLIGYWAKLLTPEEIEVAAVKYYGAETFAAEREYCLKQVAHYEHKEISTNVRHGERLTAAVFRALEAAEAPPGWKTQFEKLFQTLGEKVWNAGKLKVALSLTCAPSAFLRLGHYGEKSCYGNGKQHQGAKWWLATDQPGSFVVLAYQPRTKDGKLAISTRTGARVGRVVGRGWGIALPESAGVLVTNFYLLGFDQLLPQVQPLLTKALGLEGKIELLTAEKLTSFKASLWGLLSAPLSRAVYLNRDSALLLRVPLEQAVSLATDVLNYTSLFGLHTNAGNGPEKNILYYAGPGNFPASWKIKIDLIGEARKWAEKMAWNIHESGGRRPLDPGLLAVAANP